MISFIDDSREKIRNIGSMNTHVLSAGRIQILETGNLHLYDFGPQTTVEIRIWTRDTFALITDLYNEQTSQIKILNKEIYELKQENTRIKQMLEEIYYSPGMPGFFEAESDFNSMNGKK
jgi:hypothetical protein